MCLNCSLVIQSLYDTKSLPLPKMAYFGYALKVIFEHWTYFMIVFSNHNTPSLNYFENSVNVALKSDVVTFYISLKAIL